MCFNHYRWAWIFAYKKPISWVESEVLHVKGGSNRNHVHLIIQIFRIIGNTSLASAEATATSFIAVLDTCLCFNPLRLMQLREEVRILVSRRLSHSGWNSKLLLLAWIARVGGSHTDSAQHDGPLRLSLVCTTVLARVTRMIAAMGHCSVSGSPWSQEVILDVLALIDSACLHVRGSRPQLFIKCWAL